MEDYLYYVTNNCGVEHIVFSFNDAMEWYEDNKGTSVIAKSKDLFPTYKTIIDKPNIDTERIRKDWTMKNTTKAQRKAIEKYDGNNCKQFKMKLNKNTDADIIAYLENCDNKQGIIKELIRNEIAKQQKLH